MSAKISTRQYKFRLIFCIGVMLGFIYFAFWGVSEMLSGTDWPNKRDAQGATVRINKEATE